MLGITAHMRLVTVVTAPVFAGVAGVSVRGGAVFGCLHLRPLAAGFNNRRVHDGGGFDDVAPRLQLLIEQTQQRLMQTASNEPLAEAADRGLIGHGFVSIELDEFLETQPVLDLLLGLRIAQAVKMLQNHDPQKKPDPIGRPASLTVGGGHARLGLAKIDFTGNDFQHAVAGRSLLHGQIKKGGLLLSRYLHESQTQSSSQTFNSFAEISERIGSFSPRLARFREGLPWAAPFKILYPEGVESIPDMDLIQPLQRVFPYSMQVV